MTKSICSLILFLFLASDLLKAQQLPLFSQYRENQSVLNPAALNIDYIRNDYNLTFGISRRKQWDQADLNVGGSNLSWGPQTLTARVEYVTPDSRIFGGMHILSDQAGTIDLTGIYIRGGYFIIDPKEANGALTGAISLGYNMFEVKTEAPGLFSYNTQYTAAGFANPGVLPYWDFSVGLFGWFEGWGNAFEGDIIYLGLSIPQMRGLPLDKSKSLANDRPESESFLQGNFVAGIYKNIASGFVEASINFNKLYRAKDQETGEPFKAPYIITPNVRYNWKNTFWVGTGFKLPVGNRLAVQDLLRVEGRVSTMLFEAGFNASQVLNTPDSNIRIGAGYEIPLGEFLKLLGNSFELNLTYTLDTASSGRR